MSLGCFGLPSFGLTGALEGSIKPNVLARAKSVLILYMDGGPSHLDMFDMKPGAPAEIRGPVSFIGSSVPGAIGMAPNVTCGTSQARRATMQD